MRRTFAAAIAVLVLVLAGCGTESSDDAALEEANQRIAQLEEEVSGSTASEEPQAEGPAATDPPQSQALMPDVVCMNLQVAQDHIQAETGVFLSLSEDATGADRMQIVDSNWLVVAQRPAPGTPIGEGDAVLSAVKVGEPNDC